MRNIRKKTLIVLSILVILVLSLSVSIGALAQQEIV
jgi:hypothetical protein